MAHEAAANDTDFQSAHVASRLLRGFSFVMPGLDPGIPSSYENDGLPGQARQ
jgi:hypothetical protein